MGLVEKIHGNYHFGRRIQRLSNLLADSLSLNLSAKKASILDVGCGDGALDRLIVQKQFNFDIKGVDVLVRRKTYIPVVKFDGNTIPYNDSSFDAVMFVDVLHHMDDPMIMLKEARRVASKFIIIKDHTLDGWFAKTTLCFMDEVGNRRHGVALPYNYWPKKKWLETFDCLGFAVDAWKDSLKLYPWPASCIFDRSLHFIAQLRL